MSEFSNIASKAPGVAPGAFFRAATFGLRGNLTRHARPNDAAVAGHIDR